MNKADQLNVILKVSTFLDRSQLLVEAQEDMAVEFEKYCPGYSAQTKPFLDNMRTIMNDLHKQMKKCRESFLDE